ncbi:MAG TPA: hypothetical protein VNJ53_01305, partial [Gaiellaceae bacterium]|nr:hypothetical protein [Gaiellaceae bacterium]
MISWTELRDEAVAAWGQAPGEALEDEVAAVFRERPRLVAMELARVSEAHKKAAIHSPWAVLRARLRSALRALDV